jgi:signal peptidase II
MYFYLLAAIVFLIDQAIKQSIHAFISFGQSVPLINKFLYLTYVRNTGAAFSLFLGFSFYLAIIGMAAIAAIFYFHFKIERRDYYMQTALGLILGGSLGNVFDRVVRHFVIDYIDFRVFPVFNFADMMINLGMLLIIIRILTKDKL